MSRRHKAREVVVQMLYQLDLNEDVAPDAVRGMIQEELRDETLARFAWSLFAGVMEARKQLDERIASAAANWSLGRMPPTDRNVLRLGAYELLFTETPHRVVIDEALELAKTYGTAQSSAFVNGILDRMVPSERRRADAGVSRTPASDTPSAE
ncbi:MAG: transcription antitermination factor NusB [Planctomycetaceae bacterium]|jgi:N utilization substance protein B|nr:transcription antitermination factor NusB [Planctomycetaceae bacterium]